MVSVSSAAPVEALEAKIKASRIILVGQTVSGQTK